VFIGILAMPWPSCASEKITVEQLEQILARHAFGHDSAAPETEIIDNDLVQQLGSDDQLLASIPGLELSERLSTTTMFRLVWRYHLGPHMQRALEELSDRTALLKPPDSEQPNLPVPDAAAQQGMLRAAQDYVLRELSHLPNFIATQTTTRFDDAPPSLENWWVQLATAGGGMHRLGSRQRQITFRDGKEVTDGNSTDPKFQVNVLESRGEFGTEAAVVVMDVGQGSIAFSHWEKTMAGIAAVYQYAVPRKSSHYEVKEECGKHGSFQDSPAYHGTLALDPKTGAIFRMTLEAESNPDDPVSHVASVIEYGPVVLGHRRTICPLRSLAFLVKERDYCFRGSRKLHKPVTMINETIFSNYRRFGSSATFAFDGRLAAQESQRNTSEKTAGGAEKNLSAKPSTAGVN